MAMLEVVDQTREGELEARGGVDVGKFGIYPSTQTVSYLMYRAWQEGNAGGNTLGHSRIIELTAYHACIRSGKGLEFLQPPIPLNSI
jgi:hypothetical protein